MQLHLNPFGGISGNMFVGALVDAFPEHRDVVAVAENIRKACDVPELVCQADCEWDGVLRGAHMPASVRSLALGFAAYRRGSAFVTATFIPQT
jgi:hypothetical protein